MTHTYIGDFYGYKVIRHEDSSRVTFEGAPAEYKDFLLEAFKNVELPFASHIKRRESPSCRYCGRKGTPDQHHSCYGCGAPKEG